MTPLVFGVLALCGGVGAGLRYTLDSIVMRGRTGVFPLGILIVNVVGSFVLGGLTGAGHAVSVPWMSMIGVGLLGGFTTFSAVSVETILLARAGRRDWAWTNLFGTFALTVVAAGAGIALGGLIPR